MALQLGALNQALRKAGVDEDLARQAAEEVAAHEDRLGAIEQRLIELRAYIDHQLAELRGENRLLRWMTGSFGAAILAFQVAIFVKLFVH